MMGTRRTGSTTIDQLCVRHIKMAVASPMQGGLIMMPRPHRDYVFPFCESLTWTKNVEVTVTRIWSVRTCVYLAFM